MLHPIGGLSKKLNTSVEDMLANVRHNVQRPDVEWLRAAHVPHKRVACLVGGGPSLHDDIDNIRSRQKRGQEVWALNGAHDFLISKNITPDYHVILDAREENADFVRNPQKGCTYLISAMCHPKVFDALKGHKVLLWLHAMHDKRQDEALALGLAVNPDRWYGYIEGGSTVGLRAMGVAFALGYRNAHLYGYDSSYVTGPDGKPIGVTQGHAYSQPLNERDNNRVQDVHAAGRIYWATPWMASQVEQMQHWAPLFVEMGMKITIHGRGLLPWVMSQREVVDVLPPSELERRKWMALWEQGIAPKDNAATLQRLATFFPLEPGNTVVDFGCGDGSLAAAMAKNGVAVTGIDFATNAPSPEAQQVVSFQHDNLWMMPDAPRATVGICRDVLSHIPKHRLDDVLAGMARRAESVYFEEDPKFLPAIRKAFSAAHDMRTHLHAVNIERPNMVAVYDLSVSPPTYDFFSFLLAAENRRMLNRFPTYGGIDLVIRQGPDRGFRIDDSLPRDIDMRQMMLRNTVIGGAELCPSVKSIRWVASDEPIRDVVYPKEWTKDDPKSGYGLIVQVQNMRRPGTLRAPEWAKRYVAHKMGGRPYVTFTLRNAAHWPTRNSDREAWIEARQRIVAAGTRVVWLDDIEQGGGDFPEAVNPSIRMAMYEGALDNYGVNNGPMWLALTNKDVRACIFRVAQHENPTTSPEYFERCGLPVGTQPTNPNHRLVWGPDTADAIVSAFHERNQRDRAA